MTHSFGMDRMVPVNVMLIKRLNASLAERLTIGRVHESADSGKNEGIRLV